MPSRVVLTPIEQEVLDWLACDYGSSESIESSRSNAFSRDLTHAELFEILLTLIRYELVQARKWDSERETRYVVQDPERFDPMSLWFLPTDSGYKVASEEKW